MRRGIRAVPQVLFFVIGILLLCYGAARLVLAEQIHRVSQLSEIVETVRIGDREDSIAPFLKRFGAHRWDRQLGSHEDYNYVFEINPWRFPSFLNYNSEPVRFGLNARFRRAIALRHWMAWGEIGVKNKLVVAVQAELYVEGKTKWLGTYWRLAEKPREYERDPNVEYLQWPPEPDLEFVSPGFLEMGTGVGSIWEFWVRPTWPRGERVAAQLWNLGCLSSFRGCDTMCDLLPEATRLFKERSELAPRGGGWDESLRSCGHNAYDGWN